MDNDEVKRLYYTSGEVAKMLRVRQSYVVYWAERFLLTPRKLGTWRKFTAKDIAEISGYVTFHSVWVKMTAVKDFQYSNCE